MNGKHIMITVMYREADSVLSNYQDINIDVLTVPPMCLNIVGVVSVKKLAETRQLLVVEAPESL